MTTFKALSFSLILFVFSYALSASRLEHIEIESHCFKGGWGYYICDPQAPKLPQIFRDEGDFIVIKSFLKTLQKTILLAKSIAPENSQLLIVEAQKLFDKNSLISNDTSFTNSPAILAKLAQAVGFYNLSEHGTLAGEEEKNYDSFTYLQTFLSNLKLHCKKLEKLTKDFTAERIAEILKNIQDIEQCFTIPAIKNEILRFKNNFNGDLKNTKELAIFFQAFGYFMALETLAKELFPIKQNSLNIEDVMYFDDFTLMIHKKMIEECKNNVENQYLFIRNHENYYAALLEGVIDIKAAHKLSQQEALERQEEFILYHPKDENDNTIEFIRFNNLLKMMKNQK